MAEEKTNEAATEPNVDELKARIAELENANAKLKAANDNSSSQAAEFKKKWRDTLSEQERKDAEIAEQRAKETAELETLRAEKRLSGYTAKLMDCGFDSATAAAMAKALPADVSEDYFSAQKNFLANREAAIRNDLLKGQSGVGGGKAPESDAHKANEQLRKYFGL